MLLTAFFLSNTSSFILTLLYALLHSVESLRAELLMLRSFDQELGMSFVAGNASRGGAEKTAYFCRAALFLSLFSFSQ